MEKKEFIDWVAEIKQKLPVFLNRLQGKKEKGFYKYSYSGDLYNEKFNWGLGNSVFALKIYYSLNIIPENLNEIISFIQTFQKTTGEFYDPVVKYTALPMLMYSAIKSRDLNRLKHSFIRRAETRQSISSLKLFNKNPRYIFQEFPKNKTDIKEFIDNLDWKMPWGAGSHFSHLMFFLSSSDIDDKIELINFTIRYIEKYKKNDGCWYEGNPDLQIKINGAMKIITGLKAAAKFANINEGKVIFNNVKEIIDTALKASNDEHTCSNFNLTYVMRYANELTQGKYKYNEIENFIKQRLDIYKQFYYDKYGAFSFYKNKANTNYYGAYITKGRNEPDIHGTVLFLWGLAVIGNFWSINEQIRLQEFIT